ncbi:copia protein [Tanacetum coccineum]
MNSPPNHGWEHFLDINKSDLQLSAPLRLSNTTPIVRNICFSQTQEMDYGDERPIRIIPGPAGIIQTDSIHKLPNVSDAHTQEYIRKFIDDVEGGCFGYISSYLKNGKLKKVVALITSCTPNVIGDMNVTLKDPSGTMSGTIHHKVLLDDFYAKAIKVGSALILNNVSVFYPKSSNYYLNITIRNLVKVFEKETVVETLS